MTGHPELPYLAIGFVAVAGATIKNDKVPDLALPAIGTIGLVVVTSASADTKVEPLVTAIGHLLLLSVVIATVNAVRTKTKKGKKK